MKALISISLLALLFAQGCAPADDDETQSEPVSEYDISIEIRPWTLPSDGISKGVVFVELRKQGQSVNDSTQVILLNTGGTLRSGIIYTSGGVALDTLTADTVAGLNWIIAYSHGIRDSAEVQFSE